MAKQTSLTQDLLHMNDPYNSYTFHDFHKKGKGRPIKANIIRLHNKVGNRTIAINVYLSNVLRERDTTDLRIREDNYTGEIDLIFGKKGLAPQKKLNTNHAILYGCLEAVEFIADKVAGIKGDFNTLDLDAKVISTTNDIVVVRLSKIAQ